MTACRANEKAFVVTTIPHRWGVSQRSHAASPDAARVPRVLPRWSVFLFVSALLLAPWGCESAWSESPAEADPTAREGESAAEASPRAASLRDFTESIYPLLSREDSGCLECHRSEETSNLVLIGNPRDDFEVLFQNRYFDPEQPDGLLARVTSDDPDLRMPQDGDRWSERDIHLLRSFLRRLDVPLDPHADERFPAALTTPYSGDRPTGTENPFITATQLRGKVRTIFEDDWVRDGRDRFAENVAVFGGADFETRFTETREPSTSFLSGLTMLAADVCHRALLRRGGPFAGHHLLGPPGDATRPNADYRDAIARLYRAILFRSPSESETRRAYDLIRDIYDAEPNLRGTDYDLAFRVTVIDRETNLEATRTIRVPVGGESTRLYQEWVNQSAGTETGQAGFVRHTLAPRFRFAAGETARVVIRNDHSVGNVSFAGVQWKPAGEGEPHTIRAEDPEVRIEGSWGTSDRGGRTSFEDGDVEKGNSHITVSWEPPKEGKYELSILWRHDPANAEQVLVEVRGDRVPDVLALPVGADVPERGEARFFYDCSDDTLPFADLGAWFRFDGDDRVEIRNAGTRGRVTAAAIEFVPLDGQAQPFTIDSVAAEGADAWEQYDAGRFRAYNTRGTQLHDNDRNKGERYLRYRPGHSDGTEEWRAEHFYRPHIYYPGKRDHTTRAPVIVRARQSSPIVQVRHPSRARVDAEMRLDASASYTVQQSDLTYVWEQIEGPPVHIDPADGSDETGVLRFIVPRRSPQQVAWEALAQGLMRHPDFLFTRPPSLGRVEDPDDRKRLQLVKIALDLVGRSPNREELRRLADGASLAELVDHYLDSQEFRDFYFHRIRLYLESQGTESQDEPVRLWCYVAFEDRPFQEILTADYTVDTEFRQRPRPAHHGRTGLLTTKGFIEGKPGLPHYNYAAQVSMMFLGYVFEVPSDIIDQRDGITPAGTTDRSSACYSCHKTLTPLAMQRQFWADDGSFRTKDPDGLEIDASDQGLVDEYPFPGVGMEAFATQAVRKERFIRTMINTHFHFYMGRNLRFRTDERGLYKELWDHVHEDGFTIRGMIRKLMSQPEYLAES